MDLAVSPFFPGQFGSFWLSGWTCGRLFCSGERSSRTAKASSSAAAARQLKMVVLSQEVFAATPQVFQSFSYSLKVKVFTNGLLTSKVCRRLATKRNNCQALRAKGTQMAIPSGAFCCSEHFRSMSHLAPT